MSQTTREVKDAVNRALDELESAGIGLAELTPPGKDSLTERLGATIDELEQWKADVWEALDAGGR